MTIYKYPLPIQGSVQIAMPAGARVLSVQMQGDDAYVWALVDRSARMKTRIFRVFGTGHAFNAPAGAMFVGTIQMHAGSLVFHVFDLGEG